MRSNSKHTWEELERFIRLYLEDGKSFRELSEEYGLLLSESAFIHKVLKYQKHGLLGIQPKSNNNHYSKAFKEAIVQEYYDGSISIRELARKYNIPAYSTVRQWIIKYTNGEENRSYTPKPEVYTMKGQKKTQDEKIQIVKDYLTHGLSYKDTAEKYQVSYNNVYAWVQKYKQHGPDGLGDGRGRGKPNTIQTDEEKLRAEITEIKARNGYLEAENAALKKLKEVERELMLRKHGLKQNTKRSKNSKEKDTK
ncbi:transposase [Fundicoccus sp. Sow4_H7]|uniref:transposase n=1 Tax=Fundicoccus sp. Sow4_H7 TaxID=3438784 RepID=UPI003F8E5178